MFSYELSSVPFALSHKDCSLGKSEKSVLMSILEKRVNVFPQLPSEGDVPTAVMIDGMALIQKLRAGGATNFGDLCMWYYRKLVNAFRRCSRIDVMFDTFRNIPYSLYLALSFFFSKLLSLCLVKLHPNKCTLKTKVAFHEQL